jgi:hypothetical protein
MQRVDHCSRGNRRGEMACASYGVQPCGTGRCADPRCGPCVSRLQMMHGIPGCLTPVTCCEAIELALGDHAETLSYRWRNEEILLGVQVVEMRRRIKVHNYGRNAGYPAPPAQLRWCPAEMRET